MSGNKIGGLKTAKVNVKKYGKDFYKRIGAIGGRKSRGGGFASDKIGKDGLTGHERARFAGMVGGKATRTSHKASVEAKKRIHNILQK